MSLSKNTIKFVRSLQQKKYRDKYRLFVVEGLKSVGALLRQDRFATACVYCLDKDVLAVPEGVQCLVVSRAELQRISGFNQPCEALAVVRQATHGAPNFEEDNLILLLDTLRDPGNVGTIIRTAHWFGIHQIICSPTTVEHYNPKVVQASMGSLFDVQIHRQALRDSIAALEHHHFDIVAGALNGTTVFSAPFAKKTALIMGSEAQGVSPDVLQRARPITIPSNGKTDSLNVAIATGILLSFYAKSLS